MFYFKILFLLEIGYTNATKKWSEKKPFHVNCRVDLNLSKRFNRELGLFKTF